MKHSLRFLPLTILALCAFAWSPRAIAAEPVVIHDFAKGGFDYGFGAWEGLGVQTTNDKGTRLNGPANGGAGLSLFSLADLSDCKTLVVRVKRHAEGTTDEKFVINLISVDGGKAACVIQTADISDHDFTDYKIDLKKLPVGDDNKHVNLEEIKNVQVQGVFTPDKTLDLEFAAITAIP